MLIIGTRTFYIKKAVACEVFYCEICDVESRWELVNCWTWLTFFFLPIFPIWFRRAMRCPVCEHGIKITRKNREEIMEYFDEPYENL